MAAAGYYVFHEALSGGEYVRVPNIVGSHVTDASLRLAEQGLEMGKLRELPDERVARGHVITQRPSAGRVVRTGRKVYPTVSAGDEMIPVENYVNRPIEGVRDEIEQRAYHMGTVARIPHSAPRGTIIAQDPAPPRSVRSDGEVHFLVSDSPSAQTFLMPDLKGKPVQEVLRLLSPMGVLPVPRRVDTVGAEYNVVLDQQPAAGTLIHEGATVAYFVRPSGDVALPDSRRLVEVTYTIPPSASPRAIRVDTLDRNGVRQTVYPQLTDYVEGAPPRLVSGQSITIPIWFIGEMTVEIFIDQVRVRSLYYKGDAEAIVKTYSATSGAPEI